MSPPQASFYVTGGTLRGDASCYVPRQADRDLYDGLKRGEFCYVLTSRQMGKSSLMVRTAQRLRQEEVDVAVLDLTAVGQNLTVEQWYDGLLGHLGQQLRLEDELEQFWQDHVRLAPLQRWLRALREVVLPRCRSQLVIFVDEIDAVQSLPFSTDEFFAAIRECYNRRSEDPELARLTFCLLGVATPSDLIRDTRTTPFNIGRRVELRDFTEAEAVPLAQGLGRDERLAAKLLQRVLYWTGGHPYLTQRLCLAVAQDPGVVRPAGVDRICEELFLSHRVRERDDNLLFVRERMLRSNVDRASLLDMYLQVRRHRRVRDEETSSLASILRLSGITRVVEGYLWVRNRIYYRVFDQEWIQANMPDAEKRRQRRAYRRGVLRASAVAAVLFALAGACLYWYLDGYVWDHVAYFANQVKRFGIAEGVGPLSRADVAGRAGSFKFHRKGRYGPVLRVEVVNSRDDLKSDHQLSTYLRSAADYKAPVQTRECQWEFVRDNQGNILYEKALDRNGRLVWAFVYTPRRPGDPVLGHFVGPNGYPQMQRTSTAEYVEIEYTPEGFERFRRYRDRRGEKEPGPDNAYGRYREYDERGLVLKDLSVDVQDKPMVDAAGNAGMVQHYDAMGNVLWELSIDPAGQPIRLKNGWVKCASRYDERGNRIEQAYFDDASQPTLHKDGFARWTAKYDERGNRVEAACFDEHSQPTCNKDGYAKWTADYDEHANIVEMAYFDEAGQPTRHKNGYAKWTAEYDERGNSLETTYFDEAGQPTRHKDGYAKWTARYDERGNKVEAACFDEHSQPTRNKDGYAKWTARYDERGNQVEAMLFDETGQPTRNKDGVAKGTTRYDERGNKVEGSCFDEAGRPTRNKDGYAKWTAKYDEGGNKVETSYFDETGQSTRDKYAVARVTASYDERGNKVEVAFFDEAGQPTRHKDGYAKVTAKFDERGNKVEAACFDEHGQSTRDKDAVAKWTARFDERGNNVETAYFNEAGQPTRHKDGYAKVTAEYDERGNSLETSYFDEAGQPTRHKDGYAKVTAKYDERGNKVEAACFDEHGQSTRDKDAIAKWTARFDERGNNVETAYFNEAGQPTRHKDGYAKVTARYDERGNRVEEAHFDEKDQPSRPEDAVAKLTAKYDERGNWIESAWFDEHGQPMHKKDGYAKWTAKYDDRGNKVEVAYFDEAGQPTRDNYLVARWIARYDERDQEVETAFFDEAGQPTRNKDGYSKWTKKYDAAGSDIEDTFWGYDGSQGFAKMVVKLNDRGWKVETAYFDAVGQAARKNKNGYSKLTKKYDASGRDIEDAYWGYDGSQGYAKIVAKFNDKGRSVETAYFSATDEPARDNRTGYSKWTRRYDASGKVVEDTYWGYDGRQGYAKKVVKVNDKGWNVETAYFDAADQPTRHQIGYSKWTTKYDNSGKAVEDTYWGYDGRQGYTKLVVKLNDRQLGIENTYFDAADKPTRHQNGYSKWTRKYDAAGKDVEDVYWGYDGSQGFAKMVVKLNSKGLGIENTYFDAANKPTRYKDGYSKWTRKYDASGNDVEDTFWGYDGSQGFAKRVVKYNDKRQIVETAYFNAADEPARNKNGYSKWTTRYDASGKAVEDAFWGYDGRQGYTKKIVKLNDKRWNVETAYFDAADQPARYQNSYSKWTKKYDASGRDIEDTYWGYDGSQGFAKKVSKYNTKGWRIETAYFDAAGEPARYKNNNSKWTTKYDDLGKTVEDAYWGYDGSLGFAKKVIKRNDKGLAAEISYFDAADKPTTHIGGYARRVNVYDARNVLVDVKFYNQGPVDVNPLVTQVTPGGQGAKLGLKKGDVFLQYDGAKLTNWVRFFARRKAEQEGDAPRELVVRRGDQTLRFQVRPGPLSISLDVQVVPSQQAVPPNQLKKQTVP